MTVKARRGPGVVPVVGFAALVALGVAVLIFRASAVHEDGFGPLGSLGRGGFESMSVDPKASHAEAWTFGLPLCIAEGDQPAILRKVLPAATAGTGFHELGTRMRTFVLTPQDEPIISVDSFPPLKSQVPDPLAQVDGYVVRTPCGSGTGQPYTELLVGLAMDGDDGGGWKGINVQYEVDGRHLTVHLNHDLLICGRSNPDCP